MRYWTYVEPGEDGKPNYVTVSEEEIRRNFYPTWRKRMIERGYSVEDLCFLDCLDDWQAIHFAWEVEE